MRKFFVYALLLVFLAQASLAQEADGYTEPEVACHSYYSIISVVDEESDSPTITDPCGDRYLVDISVDKSDEGKCRRIDGSLPAEEYEITDIPMCEGSIEDFLSAGEDVFGIAVEEEEEPEADPKAGNCEGELLAVDHRIKNNELDFSADVKNTGDSDCSYYLCLYPAESDTPQECAGGIVLKPGMVQPMEISSRDVLDVPLFGWDVGSLKGNYTVRLFAEEASVASAVMGAGCLLLNPLDASARIKCVVENAGLVDSMFFKVCRDRALSICHAEGEGTDWMGLPQEITGVLDAEKYSSVAVVSESDTVDRWYLIDSEAYTRMDYESCVKDDVRTTFYTLAKDEEYLKYVREEFGEEPFYKKYSAMYGEETAAWMYCYKTDLRDTIECVERNRDLYALFDDVPQFMTEDYIDRIKLWNAYQDVDELDVSAPTASKGPFKNTMARLFAATPLVEMPDASKLTSTGDSALYIGEEADRGDSCEMSCDAKRECNLLSGCAPALGRSDECSNCVIEHDAANTADCTKDSDGECNSVKGDCGQICKIDARPYQLEAVPGAGKDFYGIPYDGQCPKGFSLQDITVYTNRQQPPGSGGEPSTEKIKMCVLAGGVVGVTVIEFPSGKSDGEESGRVEISTNPLEIREKRKEGVDWNRDVWEIVQTGADGEKLSVNIIEKGNMPFEIKYAGIEKKGDEYVLTRVYVPEDHERKFIVDSDVTVNYTLLKSAGDFDILLEHTYVTSARRDVYYVACLKYPCKCSSTCDEIKEEFTVLGETASCGGVAVDYGCACDACDADCCGCRPRYMGDTREIKTELMEDVSERTESIHIDAVSDLDDLLCESLDEFKIEGAIDMSVDEKGTVTFSSSLEEPMKITVSPDILAGFELDMGKSSYLNYAHLLFPTVHELSAKRSSPGENERENVLDDDYRLEEEAFGYLEQCRKICPVEPMCIAEDYDPLKMKCLDVDVKAYVPRTDCVGPLFGCYENPCVSERNFHEEEGSRIANGDFESGKLFWSGDGSVSLGGFGGHMLKLLGSVEQDIPEMHALPYEEICLEYAVYDYLGSGAFELYVTTAQGVDEFTVYGSANEASSASVCRFPVGWNKKCFGVEGPISKVRLESDLEVYVDNVNLGRYYDYATVRAYEVSDFEVADLRQKGWESVGLLKFGPGGVTHEGDTYTFGFSTLSRTTVLPGSTLSEYSLSEADLKNATFVLRTPFTTEVIPLYPNVYKKADGSRPDGCYEVNITIREPSNLDVSYIPNGYGIPRGQKTEWTVLLTNALDGRPLANQKVYLSIRGDDIFKYEPTGLSDEGDGIAAFMTDGEGIGRFTFKPQGTVVDFEYLGSSEIRQSPAYETVLLHTVGGKSPLLSGEFILLVLIMLLAVFSYRFFREGRFDLASWLKDLKGKK